MPTPPAPADEYQVSHLGLVRGSFRFDLVEAMILAGTIPKDVKIRKKTGGDWQPAPPVGVAANSVSFADSSPLRQKSVTTTIGVVGGVALLLAAMLITVAISSTARLHKTSATTSSATPTPTPAVKRQTALPASVAVGTPKITTPPKNWYYSSSSSLPKTSPATSSINLPPPVKRAVAVSTPVAAPPSTTTFRDASGQTYRLSNYDYQRLQQMRRKLDSEETFVDQQKAKVDQYGRDIDNSRRSVNQYSQASVNQFNAKINSYNDQLKNIQGSIDRFNRKVDEFNAELRRVGTPIR